MRRIGITGVAQLAEHLAGAQAVARFDLDAAGLQVGVEGVDAMTLEDARKAAIEAVKQLSADVGIPADLKEIVKAEDVDFLSQSAFDDACRPGNPRDTSVEEIKELYLNVY
mgnify:CR=1 FL=1